MSLREFAAHAAAVLPATVGGCGCPATRSGPCVGSPCAAGAGDRSTDAAAAAGADVFLTSDLKHHPVSDALEVPGPALVDVAHFATEWPWLPVAAEALRNDLAGRVEVSVSRLRTDPWTWHAGQENRPAGEPGARR